MNLILDVGNSYVKLAVYSKNRLLKKVTFLHNDLHKEIPLILKKYRKINDVIVSSVGALSRKDVAVLLNKINCVFLNHKTKLPFANLYKTPKSLGVDRIALVSSAAVNYPNRNVLVIDAGTCITYDFLSEKNAYFGGAISPGLTIRYTSLNNLTANLPLLKPKAPKNLIGQTTKTSIHSGVVNGVLKEIDGTIDDYKQKYEDLTVILTGGDAKFLSKRLKNTIFANSNFLFEGLNYILEFNKS